jgi:hypothetical protein
VRQANLTNRYQSKSKIRYLLVMMPSGTQYASRFNLYLPMEHDSWRSAGYEID